MVLTLVCHLSQMVLTLVCDFSQIVLTLVCHLVLYRILVFSKGRIETVVVEIDGIDAGEVEHVQGPLFVVPWQPSRYAEGLHTITVSVKVSVLYFVNISVCVHTCAYVFAHIGLYLLHLSVCLFVFPFDCLSVCRCVCLFGHLSVCL